MTSDDHQPASTADGKEGARSADATAESAERRRRSLPLWQETILLLAVALILAVLIKALFVQAFYIPSESMEPGLVRNDRILVQKVSYWGGASPERGDVVVFKDPGGWLSGLEETGPTSTLTQVMSKIGLYPSGGHLVKRVIGIEGDVVTCCDDQGRILVNGVPLNEDGFIQQDGQACDGPMPTQGSCNEDWSAGPIPKDNIFVMGDNRGHSADSSEKLCPPTVEDCVPGREFVPADLVVGKVFVLLWPRDHFRWVKRPATFADVTAAP